jgi:prepilin-type N-terminal cleavage/methylation domain-containing protein
MQPCKRSSLAFTLMELMVVVVIIGVITAFASANYSKAFNRQNVRISSNNLITIYSAQQGYYARTNSYYGVRFVSTLSDINQNLGLNIMIDPSLLAGAGTDYYCDSTQQICDVDHHNLWHLKVGLDRPLDSTTNPCCNVGGQAPDATVCQPLPVCTW